LERGHTISESENLTKLDARCRIVAQTSLIEHIIKMNCKSSVPALLAVGFALLLLCSTSANGQRAKRFAGNEAGSNSEGNQNIDEAFRDYVYNMVMSRLNMDAVDPMMVSKRGPHGYLDFGVSRGASGAEAAKARLGLKLAHNPFGPGR